MALRLQYDVYKAQGDQAKQMQTLVKLMGADPTNVAAPRAGDRRARDVGQGRRRRADHRQRWSKANPGDPQYMRTHWLVLRAAQHWKEAIAAGQAYVAADPTAADSNYYLRLIADYGVGQRIRQGGGSCRAGDREVPAQRPALPAQGAERAEGRPARRRDRVAPQGPRARSEGAWRQPAARPDERRTRASSTRRSPR